MPKKQASRSKTRKSSISRAQGIENIRERAYFIWAEKGYPENSEIDNWLEAERQLCN